MKQRGLLGPIGDDLPSLIPLIFALLIFFYAFTITWDIADKKNEVFEDDIEIISVGNTLKSDSYIVDLAQFKERCTNARSIRRLNFEAGLIELSLKHYFLESPGMEEAASLFDLPQHFYDLTPNDLGDQEDSLFECSSTEEEFEHSAKNYIVKFYPVALETRQRTSEPKSKFFVKPMVLVVIAWKNG